MAGRRAAATIVNIRVRSPSYFYMDRSIRAQTVMSRQEQRLKQEAEGEGVLPETL